MKIASLTLHNFRSVTDAKFELGNYCLLIGANNCGKSNVIDALRVFYEKDARFEEKRDCPKCCVEDEECWIDVEFALSEEEEASLKEEYRRPNRRVKVRKYLKTHLKGSDKKPKSGIYGFVGNEIADEPFYGAKNVQQGKFGTLIYIPASSKIDDHTKLSGSSALRDLLTDILTQLVGSSAAFADLTRHFDSFADRIKREETGDNRSLSNLEEEISDNLREWGTEFRLSINCVTEADIIKNLVGYSIADPCLSGTLDPSRYGHGFQRHLVFTLIRLAAKYVGESKTPAKKDFAPKLTLLLFEEPEAFLHPPQQLILKKNLHKIAGQEDHQVIASSHSPNFVSHSSDDIPSLVKLRREKGITKAYQILNSKLAEIFQSNAAISSIIQGEGDELEDVREEVEAVNYFMWLDPDRCGMFFSSQVLLVEGVTERILINYMINEGMIEAPKGGVLVLDCMGKHNIHRFMNLLDALGVPHSVLYDGDNQKNHHASLNALIIDSKKAWTSKIEVLPSDLEEFLGINKPKDRYKKPRIAMLNLRKGRIKPEKLSALAEHVQALFQ